MFASIAVAYAVAAEQLPIVAVPAAAYTAELATQPVQDVNRDVYII
jgi:hypothetical protein